jgi:hypothetical protein
MIITNTNSAASQPPAPHAPAGVGPFPPLNGLQQPPYNHPPYNRAYPGPPDYPQPRYPPAPFDQPPTRDGRPSRPDQPRPSSDVEKLRKLRDDIISGQLRVCILSIPFLFVLIRCQQVTEDGRAVPNQRLSEHHPSAHTLKDSAENLLDGRKMLGGQARNDLQKTAVAAGNVDPAKSDARNRPEAGLEGLTGSHLDTKPSLQSGSVEVQSSERRDSDEETAESLGLRITKRQKTDREPILRREEWPAVEASRTDVPGLRVDPADLTSDGSTGAASYTRPTAASKTTSFPVSVHAKPPLEPSEAASYTREKEPEADRRADAVDQRQSLPTATARSEERAAKDIDDPIDGTRMDLDVYTDAQEKWEPVNRRRSYDASDPQNLEERNQRQYYDSRRQYDTRRPESGWYPSERRYDEDRRSSPSRVPRPSVREPTRPDYPVRTGRERSPHPSRSDDPTTPAHHAVRALDSPRFSYSRPSYTPGKGSSPPPAESRPSGYSGPPRTHQPADGDLQAEGKKRSSYLQERPPPVSPAPYDRARLVIAN